MENLNLNPEDLVIDTLGKATIHSPLGLNRIVGDNIANYVDDSESVLVHHDKNMVLELLKNNKPLPAFEAAGPREKIFFDPAKTKVAIVTCGGLCPGINNVIRSLVMELHYRYNIHDILGIRYGYRGLTNNYGYEPIPLNPAFVDDIHEKGGSLLSSSRGHQEVPEMVDYLQKNNISILFTIGGDGTLIAANKIYEEIKARKLPISVISIPKTIDNDISYVEKAFGLETAFSMAAVAIRSAHVEALGAPYGVGLVKLMGRMSGFIAANAALALSEVNFVLIPESPFDLIGPKGLFAQLEKRFEKKDHVVIIVAEGAGQDLLAATGSKDPSGNKVLADIGVFLGDAIKRHFKEQKKIEVSLKYIDPSYMVRSVPANAHDAIYCIQLAQNAVHAGMAGKTGMLVGNWNSQFTHVPLHLATATKKCLSTEDALWFSVLEATGQPMSLKN